MTSFEIKNPSFNNQWKVLIDLFYIKRKIKADSFLCLMNDWKFWNRPNPKTNSHDFQLSNLLKFPRHAYQTSGYQRVY